MTESTTRCAYPSVAKVAPSDLVTTVREIVANDPAFVYDPPGEEKHHADSLCLYAHNGEPSCLIARGLHALGVPVEELEAMDRHADGASIGYSSAYAIALGAVVTEVMRDLDVVWLDHVQSDQDQGMPYGDCVADADRFTSEVRGGAPVSDNPFDDVTSIDELLAQLAGGASVCWENPSGAGSFDPGTASDLVDAAKERLVDLMGQRQNRREAWHEGYAAGAESAHRFHRGEYVRAYDNPYGDTWRVDGRTEDGEYIFHNHGTRETEHVFVDDFWRKP